MYRGLLTNKKRCRLGGVTVSTCDAVAVAGEQAEGDERIQKVVRSARMEAHGAFDLTPGLRTIGKVREHAQLYGAQQRLRCPEAHADLHDVIWRDLRTRHCPQLGGLHCCHLQFGRPVSSSLAVKSAHSADAAAPSARGLRFLF